MTCFVWHHKKLLRPLRLLKSVGDSEAERAAETDAAETMELRLLRKVRKPRETARMTEMDETPGEAETD